MLDLSAAFDVVDHTILLQKLEILGFNESSLAWFKSYLTERSQQVYIEGSLSEALYLEAGVPQGSILGPLLYILFTNDLPEVVHDPQEHPPTQQHQLPDEHQAQQVGQLEVGHDHEEQSHHLSLSEPQYSFKCGKCGGVCTFADDSTLSLSNKDPEALRGAIKNKYKAISEYMSQNKLILNSDKTHLLIMSSSRKHQRFGNFEITLDTGNEIIEPKSEEKLLGGIVSNNLLWNNHIRDGQKSLSSILTLRINALRKVSWYCSFKIRKQIANGIVLSHITYLVQLYGGCSEYLLSGLQVLQNRAARIVTGLGWYTATETLLLQCGWLSIRQMVDYHSLLLLFKTKSSAKPRYIFSKISQIFPRETRLSTTGGIRDIRGFKTSLAKKSFLPRTIQIWNEQLPAEIRTEKRISKFKEKLKKWVKENIDT